MAYFQGAAKAATEPIELEQVQRLIRRLVWPFYNEFLDPEQIYGSYVDRDNEELEKIKSERRPGRPASTREDLLQQRITMEEREYEGGYWVPDMTDEKSVEKLRDWPGEWTSLSTLKFVRLDKNGVLHESCFPPKGQS